MKNGNTNDYSKHFNVNIEGDNEIIGKTSGMKWYQYDLSAMINNAGVYEIDQGQDSGEVL